MKRTKSPYVSTRYAKYCLSSPIYHDKNKALVHLEAIRWFEGPVCPHCGVVVNAAELQGKSDRLASKFCNCRKWFSVTVGTVFECSKEPLNTWPLSTHLITSSKKGVCSHELH